METISDGPTSCFPLDGLAPAHGISSEIVLLRRLDGGLEHTGWFRCWRSTGRSLYTGFYTTETVPLHEGRCVKVVFPMPRGNATLLLRPENADDGGLRLVSAGSRFGDVGFYLRTLESEAFHPTVGPR